MKEFFIIWGLLIFLWLDLSFLLVVFYEDIRREYYEARLDFMIWLAQSIMRSRHDGEV